RDILDDAPGILAVRIGRDGGEIAPALEAVCPRALLINAGSGHRAGRIAGAVEDIAGRGRLVVTRGGVDQVKILVGQHSDGARISVGGARNGAGLTYHFGVRVDLVPAHAGTVSVSRFHALGCPYGAASEDSTVDVRARPHELRRGPRLRRR